MKNSPRHIFLCLLAGAPLVHAEPRMALREGTRAFEEGHFTNAVAFFEMAAKEAPSAKLDPSVAHFNRGAAFFRDKQWDPACEAFLASSLTPDLERQALALYNAGVCRLQQVNKALETGDGTNLETHLNEAIDLFGKSLLVRPGQADARHNLEFALARKAALTAAIAELGLVLQNADQLVAAHQFPEAFNVLTQANKRLAPILKLGRPEAKTFEQLLERTGQIVQILNAPTNSASTGSL